MFIKEASKPPLCFCFVLFHREQAGRPKCPIDPFFIVPDKCKCVDFQVGHMIKVMSYDQSDDPLLYAAVEASGVTWCSAKGGTPSTHSALLRSLPHWQGCPRQPYHCHWHLLHQKRWNQATEGIPKRKETLFLVNVTLFNLPSIFPPPYLSSLQSGRDKATSAGLRRPYLRVVGFDVDSEGPGRASGVPLTPSEEEELRQLASRPDIYETVAKSIAPSIYGSLG